MKYSYSYQKLNFKKEDKLNKKSMMNSYELRNVVSVQRGLKSFSNSNL